MTTPPLLLTRWWPSDARTYPAPPPPPPPPPPAPPPDRRVVWRSIGTLSAACWPTIIPAQFSGSGQLDLMVNPRPMEVRFVNQIGTGDLTATAVKV